VTVVGSMPKASWKGAPTAKQVADRFHLMQNLRESIEREMTSVSQCAGRSWHPADAGDRDKAGRRLKRSELSSR
jgi:transposase